jgi:hypothetical protein
MATEIFTTTDRDDWLIDFALAADALAKATTALANLWHEDRAQLVPDGFGEGGYPWDETPISHVAFATVGWASRVAVEAAEIIAL